MVRLPSSISGGGDGVRKGQWSTEEDEKLTEYIKQHGARDWKNVAKRAGLNRLGKSCRLRWVNYLRPEIKRGDFTQEENGIIFNLHSQIGNRWSAIAKHLPGRTDNDIKNYWNMQLRKKLQRNGIDPETHLPLPRTSSFEHLVAQLQTAATNWEVAIDIAKLQLLQNLREEDYMISRSGGSPQLPEYKMEGNPSDSYNYANQLSQATGMECAWTTAAASGSLMQECTSGLLPTSYSYTGETPTVASQSGSGREENIGSTVFDQNIFIEKLEEREYALILSYQNGRI